MTASAHRLPRAAKDEGMGEKTSALEMVSPPQTRRRLPYDIVYISKQ